MLRPMRMCVVILLVFCALPVDARTVSLRTSDGVRLKADWLAPANKGKAVMVALHMYRSNRQAWASLMAAAKTKGLGVLAVDLRGHGESAQQGKTDLSKRVAARDSSLFQAMHQDVDSALRFLKKKGVLPKRVVLVGASVGCSVALHYAATNPKVRAAILLSPGTNYLGIPSMKHIVQWGKRPLLMVADAIEVEKGARPLFLAMPDRTHGIVLTVPQKKVHGTRMFGKVPRLEIRLVEWAQLRVGETKPAKKPTAAKKPIAPKNKLKRN